MSGNSSGTGVLNWSEAAVADALSVLQRGGLCAFRTETVYGLGADATNPAAVARIFEAKGRPHFNPLISHVHGTDPALRRGEFNADALRLAESFWPGPLTLVVPRQASSDISDLASAGLDTVALRVPNAPVRMLLEAFGRPVAAPSANRSGRISPVTAGHVLEELEGRIDLILDGGPCDVGLESTVVACLKDKVTLLRPGGIPVGDLDEALGKPVERPSERSDDASPASPGMLSSHYAPEARLRLNASEPREGEAFLAFGTDTHAGAEFTGPSLNLSPAGDLVEAASKLYSFLRELDTTGCGAIAVSPIPDTGLGEAINDRLRRAAAPR